MTEVRRSSFCSGGACVEVTFAGQYVFLYGPRNGSDVELAFRVDEWQAFLDGVRAGEFDLPEASGE